jgi:hypothetical protein
MPIDYILAMYGLGIIDIAVVPIAQQNARWVAIINCDIKHLHIDGLSKLKVELISSLLWKLKTKVWTSNWCWKTKVLYIFIYIPLDIEWKPNYPGSWVEEDTKMTEKHE